MSELIWDRETVKDWFASAIFIMKKLPREKVQGYKTYWPGILYTEMELLQMEKKPIRLVASSFDIARLDAVLEWIYLVDDLDIRKIIWLRAKNYPWRLICKKYGRTRQYLTDQHNSGLDKIVKTLNDRKNPLYEKNLKLLKTYFVY